MKVFILGANGFIGSHLSEAILQKTDWEIHAIDLTQDKLTQALSHNRFHFMQGDILKEKGYVLEQIKNCDVVLPLVAIATPILYVKDPISVFELDFEANLSIIRACVKAKKARYFPLHF